MTAFRPPKRRVVGPCVWLLAWSFAAQSQEPVTFTPKQLRAHLASIEPALDRTHPGVALGGSGSAGASL